MNDAILINTLTLTAPLILAALGGLCSERAGVMNIALEGKMLTAACIAAIVGVATGSAWIGLLAGLAAAVVVSLLHALLTQAFDMDHIVSGMAINVLAFGGTNFLVRSMPQYSLVTPPVLPVVFYWLLALVAVAFFSFYLNRFRGGLRLLAVGNDPEKSRQMGLDPVRVRYLALIGTGILTGLGGVLIMSNAGNFVDRMTAGRGFIALAALILGGWRPWPTFAACLVFGFLSALQLELQGTRLFGAEIPPDAWYALPFLATLIAMAGFLGKGKAPAGLGKP